MKTGEVLLIIATLIGALFLTGCTSTAPGPGGKNPVLECSDDAKVCPDGSIVSRDGNNNCEFKPCPSPGDVKKPEVKTEDKNKGPEAAAVKEFKITAKQFTFDPATITVKKGDKVKLLVTSLDVDHGIGIKEYNINKNVSKGRTETIEFIADKAGEFDFYCSVFCGSGHKSMKGKLIVQ